MNSKMIEELKPCPEMVEKVARAIVDAVREETGGQWPLDTRDEDELSGLIDEYIDFRPLARAAIAAYDPDKRLREALELARKALDGNHIFSCSKEDVLAIIDAALSHNGG